MNSCANCGKLTDNAKFCSRSCSVSYNNSKTPKRTKAVRVPKTKTNRFEEAELTTGCYYSPDGNPGTKSLRKHLIRKHGNKCMLCGQSGDDWQGKPLTLIVDHINGHVSCQHTKVVTRVIAPESILLPRSKFSICLLPTPVL